jgi:hypothetical protein
MYICKHFKIQELVSKQVYNYFTTKYGALFCWRFFQEQILRELDKIRDYHGQAITINNWNRGGSLSQCGLRANVDPLVKAKSTPYCSGHTLGIAFDLHSADNKKLYKDIETLIKNGTLKAFRRLESPQSTKYAWVHVDGLQTTDNKFEIFLG